MRCRKPLELLSIRVTTADRLWLKCLPTGWNASRAIRASLALARKIESLIEIGATDVTLERLLRETPGPWNRGDC